jgi:predicted XRE-type DNA-binding protein
MDTIRARLKQAKELAHDQETKKQKAEHTVGSGNVFADLGLPNPEERQLKARIASLIYDVIEERGWTQKHSAEVLGISQPDVSKLTRGILKDFSVERLLYFLSRLEHRVTITVQEEKKKKPRSKIVIAANQVVREVPSLR